MTTGNSPGGLMGKLINYGTYHISHSHWEHLRDAVAAKPHQHLAVFIFHVKHSLSL